MTRSKGQPTRRAKSLDAAIQAAIASCRLRGAQITPLREAVLTALWLARKPVGAYDLKEQLSETLGRSISAASIYRTLDFLRDLGVAKRIESRNAYVACAHPGHHHTCILFVCNDCGSASEIENEKLEGLLVVDANALGFTINHRVVELSGSCADCRARAD
ncbi:MAG: Fur family transcriptional regulator [Pseudomonadota bacterium]